MNLTIDVTPEEQAAYEARAAAQGLSLEQWLKRLANERAGKAEPKAADVQSKTLAELFEPLRGLELDLSRFPLQRL